MITATAVFSEINFAPRPFFSPTLAYIILGVVGVVILFLIFFVIVCLWERQHLVGDVEPVQEPFPYPPTPYWLKTCENAARIGLRHAGDYATKKNTTLVRGLETLYLTEDCWVLAAVVSGSTAGAKLKKTILRTRLANGKILESTDNPGGGDVTGVIDRAVLLNAGIEELMRFHEQRIQTSHSQPMPFNADAVLEEHERIDLDRGKRLVLLKLAYWINPQETCIRLNLRGAFAYLRKMFSDMRKLQSQQHRQHIRRVG
jgi:hypothetical protein